ncbi:MAG: response regulator [Pseudolabrys sp.]
MHSLRDRAKSTAAMKSERPAILVVDDNEDNRYTLQTLLEADGFERIASAAGGNEAISLIEKEKFSLVLLGMMMPDLNGDEVLRLIRKKAETRGIPVVMISVDTDTDKISKCIELGADDYLPKPFNPIIGSALRRNSLRTMEAEYLSRIEKQKFRDFVTEHPAGRDCRSPSQR